MSKTFEALQKAARERDKEKKVEELRARKQTAGVEQAAPQEAEGRSLPGDDDRITHVQNYYRTGRTAPNLPVEDFRTLRQNILRTRQLGRRKALIFSSSTHGEGNSTVLVNFARTLAIGGEHVVLVDAHLGRPMLHVLTGDDRREGFGECLRQRREAREFVKATKFENVSLISAGIDGSPSCLLDSFELDFFIDQMREIADWVLFDTPPINVSNDALALASKVDGVVLVLRAEKTRWEVAQHAVERLEGAGANVVGVILNRRRMPIPDWLYRRL